MTRQEKIREDTARTFYENSDISKMIAWLDLPKDARDAFFYKADGFLSHLHSQGVVIKVERELPEALYSDGDAFTEEAVKNDMLRVGYVAVEPLIEEIENKPRCSWRSIELAQEEYKKG